MQRRVHQPRDEHGHGAVVRTIVAGADREGSPRRRAGSRLDVAEPIARHRSIVVVLEHFVDEYDLSGRRASREGTEQCESKWAGHHGPDTPAVSAGAGS